MKNILESIGIFIFSTALLIIKALGTILLLQLLNCIRKHLTKYRKKQSFYESFMDYNFIKIIDFAKWCIKDLIAGKDQLRLFGIWAFTGYYGQGKTLGCVVFAKHLQQQYPHRNIKIYSNIDIDGQVKKLKHWEELLDLPKNSIFIYDESQADFSCNNREFPDDLLRRITQCRKKQFAMFMTSPVFNRMNINIRESVNFVIRSKNILDMDRWFSYDFYRAEDYEQYHETDRLRKYRYLKFSFIAKDKTYALYNTKEEVETIRPELNDKTINKKEQVLLGYELNKFRNDMLKEIEKKIIPKYINSK